MVWKTNPLPKTSKFICIKLPGSVMCLFILPFPPAFWSLLDCKLHMKVGVQSTQQERVFPAPEAVPKQKKVNHQYFLDGWTGRFIFQSKVQSIKIFQRESLEDMVSPSMVLGEDNWVILVGKHSTTWEDGSMNK